MLVFLTSVLAAAVASSLPPSPRFYALLFGTAAFSAACAFVIVRAMTHPIQELVQKAERTMRFEEARKDRGQMIEIYQFMERLIDFVKSRETESGEKSGILEQVENLDYILPLGYMSLMVAHEVRNPLSTITGMTELLKAKTERGTERAYLEKILEASRKIDRFTKELLDFTDNELLKEEFDVREAVEEVKELLSQEFQGIECEVLGTGGFPYRGDRQKIQQALQNLMRNAFEFERLAGTGGFVRVSVSHRGHLEISVYNRGSRIEKEDLENIFKPFFTKKKGGWGIGLAIAKRNAEMHGGEITVESGAQGTTFFLRLPLQGRNP